MMQWLNGTNINGQSITSLKKLKKRENPNESRPLAVLFSPQPRSVNADFASMRNTDKASQASWKMKFYY